MHRSETLRQRVKLTHKIALTSWSSKYMRSIYHPGVEPFAVLGAISSVIAIFETSKNMYDATKNAQGSP